MVIVKNFNNLYIYDLNAIKLAPFIGNYECLKFWYQLIYNFESKYFEDNHFIAEVISN